MGRFGREDMFARRLQVRRYRQKKNTNPWVGANDLLKSDPINGSRGIPSHFDETCKQLEQLYQGLQMHYGVERLGKKWKLK